MCLIVVAHRASADYPLVIAANRDEDHARPSHAAHWWTDAPDVFGGRDAVAGGSWLAITRGGRFAAVTNLRGSAKRPDSRSRGALVSAFVTSDVPPLAYAQAVAREASSYAGFHLLVGEAGESLVWFATGMAEPEVLPDGIHAVSNGPPGARWAKVQRAIDAMGDALQQRELTEPLLRFLGTPTPGATVEETVFVSSDRYGTRSSTVIVVSATSIAATEQSWLPGGVPGQCVTMDAKRRPPDASS